MDNKSNKCPREDIEWKHDGAHKEGISLPRVRTFESFKNPVFRIFYIALVGQWFGQTVQTMARSLLIYRITGSGTVIGVLSISFSVPLLFLSLYGGAIADRIQKKYVLLIGYIGAAVVALVIALALTSGYLGAENPDSWWMLIVAAIFEGATLGFIMPARAAIIPEIVGEDGVMNAISLSTTGQMAILLVLPLCIGYLIEVYGFAAVYYLMMGVYVISSICLALLPQTKVMTAPKKNPLIDIWEGIKYLRLDIPVLLITVFGIFHTISGHPFYFLLPMFTEDILKKGASGQGVLMTVSGGGAILGSLALASLPNKKRGLMLLVSGIIMGVSLLIFSQSVCWNLSVVTVFFFGLGPAFHMTLTPTLVQYYVDRAFRGRMQSLAMIGTSLGSVGTLFAGVMSEAVGVQWAVGGIAIFFTLLSIGFIAFARPLTQLD